MSREIKFRAWDKRRNHWITFGGDVVITHGDAMVVDVGSQYILEQSTGLKDKNGVEMWEGDIIYANAIATDIKEPVYFTDGCFVINFPPQTRPVALKDLSLENFVVVGNIHENKGFLEGEK